MMICFALPTLSQKVTFKLKLPGFVNAHTHLYSGLAPLGMPAALGAPATLLDILRGLWWRLDRALDATTLRAAARYHVAHALLAGTGAVFDHHESPGFIEGSLDVLADACASLGCRAVLCYGATERNGGAREAARGIAACERFLRDNRRPLVRGAVGLHASFTVSDETIREAARLARAHGVPLHVHVAEGVCDVDDARARGYAGPVARLDALGALGEGDILVHGVHLGEDEVRLVNERGAWLVQCPRSNANNRVGHPARVARVRRVAVGTDGFPSAMHDEARALAGVMEARGDDLRDLARRMEGGRALLVRAFGDVNDDLVVDAGRVRSLTVDGRRVVHDGALLTGDLATIEAEARAAAATLWQKMREEP